MRHIHINYGADIEQSIRTLQAKIWENKDLVARYSSRYLAIRLLGDDKNIREIVASRAANSDEIDATAARSAKSSSTATENPPKRSSRMPSTDLSPAPSKKPIAPEMQGRSMSRPTESTA